MKTIHFNWEKVAGLAALPGGILQAILLLSQVGWLGVILTSRNHYHVTWEWNVPLAYRWISVSPWLFFLIALLCLYGSVAQPLRWRVWRGAIIILFITLAIVVPEIVLPFVTNCVPDLPCNPGNRLIPILLSSMSIAGGILLGGYLLLVRQALIEASFSKFWTRAFLFLGVLAFHTCLVALEVGEWVPGYFKVDITTMVLGFAWAATWCFIGCILCFKAFPQSEGRLEMSNYRRSNMPHFD